MFPIAFEVSLAIAFEVASFVFRAGRSGGTGRAALLKVTVTAAQESVVVIQVFVVLKTFVFVVFILKAAFEVFTVVVEASLVAHEASFFVRLDRSALCAELTQASLKELELAEVAVNLSVENFHFETVAQSETLKEFLTAANNPSVIAHELVFQATAHLMIELQEVGRCETFAVGRVGHHESGRLGTRELAEVSALHTNDVSDSGTLGIGEGSIDGGLVEVVAVNHVLKRTLCRVVVIYLIQHVGVEVFPLLKGIFFTEHARCDVAGNEGGFNEEGTGTAEGVNEIAFSVPSCHLDESRRKHFVDGCFDGAHSVASVVQTFAGGVKGECAFGVGDVDVETHVGVGDANGGAFAGGFSEEIDDGIFDFICHELRVAELFGIDDGVHDEGGVQINEVIPAHLSDGIIDLICILCLKMSDGFQNPDGSSKTEVGTVEHSLVAGEGNHAMT